MYILNGYNIFRHFPLQAPTKIYPNWDFWFEKIPSGSPENYRSWPKFLGSFFLRIDYALILTKKLVWVSVRAIFSNSSGHLDCHKKE
jgi:hypothetical protein